MSVLMVGRVPKRAMGTVLEFSEDVAQSFRIDCRDEAGQVATADQSASLSGAEAWKTQGIGAPRDWPAPCTTRGNGGACSSFNQTTRAPERGRADETPRACAFYIEARGRLRAPTAGENGSP